MVANTTTLTSNSLDPKMDSVTVSAIVPKWLPLEDCLQGLQGAEKQVDQVPILPFHELPPYQIEWQSLTAQLDPGTVQYGVLPKVKVQSFKAQGQAKLKILMQLCKLYPSVLTNKVAFMKKNKQMVMDILWPALFNPLTPLQLDGHPLVFIAATANIPSNFITICIIGIKMSIDDDSMVGFSTFLKGFMKPHSILNFWTTHTVTTITPELAPLAAWNQELYLLVSLDTLRASSSGLHCPSNIAADLPSWVYYNNKHFRMLFASCFDHCIFSKSNATCHTYKECTACLCSLCQDPGHLCRFCPLERKQQASKDKAAKASLEPNQRELSCQAASPQH